MRSSALPSALLAICLFALSRGAWQAASGSGGGSAGPAVDPEYAKLVGAAAAIGQKTPFPSPADVGAKLWSQISDPFYIRGTNDMGIGIQLAYSIARVMTGYFLAAAIAIPLGFLIGMSPLVYGALNPFIQVLKPISPLPCIPLAPYPIKDTPIPSTTALC